MSKTIVNYSVRIGNTILCETTYTKATELKQIEEEITHKLKMRYPEFKLEIDSVVSTQNIALLLGIC